MAIVERCYITRDNEIRLQLLDDDVPFSASQMEDITKVEVIYNGTAYDSDDYPSAFDWESEAADGIVRLKLGAVISDSGRDANAKVIIYTDDYPNGLVMGSIALIADSTAIADAE